MNNSGNGRLGFRESFIQDFLASIVVFLVALPLCLGIAIASGVPPAIGIISGIIGGIVVGYFAGCPLQVTGPAAGLVAVNLEIISHVGIEKFGLVILLGGLLQITAGVFRLGQWFRAVTPAIIQGMLAGIGVLILASQFHVMVDDAPKGSAIENLISIPMAIYKGIFPMDGTTHHLAALIGVMSIIVLNLWERRPAKLKMIPAPLVAVILSVLVAWIGHFDIKYVTISNDLMQVVRFPDFTDLSWVMDSTIWTMAFTIAFIASAETLLTAGAVDLMQTGPRTNYNKEMLAQGIGNTLCGFVGALPVTGVIVRSAANVNAGAKTRKSTILHGIWILTFVMFFPFLLGMIPISSLAAILVYTGYKLINVQTFRKLWRFGRGEAVIYLITVIAIVTTNLLEGVIIGLVATAIKMLYTFSHLEIGIEKNDQNAVIDVHLKGSATFLSIPKIAKTLESLPNKHQVFIHVQNLNWIDHACLELLMNWKKQYVAQGGEMNLELHELASKYCNNDKDADVLSSSLHKDAAAPAKAH